jgi:predicted nuclease of predicted toxin-antitoxin system
MKLLIDAQLSPAIALWINDTFANIQAVSVWQVGLRDASDLEIFNNAKVNGFIVVSKDADF